MWSALAAMAMSGFSPALAAQGPIKVEIVKTDEGWGLLRGGEPFTIAGAGGDRRLKLLKESGGNAIRTWGADNIDQILADAHDNGLGVMVGIWLMHRAPDGGGFSYNNPADLAAQKERVRQAVLAYKDHPAVLMWGLGNEMEVNGNDTPELWRHVEDLAQMVKRLDPNHPVATVTADIGGGKVENIIKYAPSVDILGINSYGGLRSIPERLKATGWTKPYVVTEFGPPGPWEVPSTEWGAPVEGSSSQKAEHYKVSFEGGVKAAKGWCVGSFAFLWGNKQEATPTWFGMMLPTGEKTEMLDVMKRFWTGKEPAQRAPLTSPLTVTGEGLKRSAKVTASDPDGDPLTYTWVLKEEVKEMKYAGEGEQAPGVLWTRAGGASLDFELPGPGQFRIYVTVRDGTGRAGTANFPIRVK
jgi:hypothetical protein